MTPIERHAVWPTPPTSEHAMLMSQMIGFRGSDWQDAFKPTGYYGDKYDYEAWKEYQFHSDNQFVIDWTWRNYPQLFNQ